MWGYEIIVTKQQIGTFVIIPGECEEGGGEGGNKKAYDPVGNSLSVASDVTREKVKKKNIIMYIIY